MLFLFVVFIFSILYLLIEDAVFGPLFVGANFANAGAVNLSIGANVRALVASVVSMACFTAHAALVHICWPLLI